MLLVSRSFLNPANDRFRCKPVQCTTASRFHWRKSAMKQTTACVIGCATRLPASVFVSASSRSCRVGAGRSSPRLAYGLIARVDNAQALKRWDQPLRHGQEQFDAGCPHPGDIGKARLESRAPRHARAVRRQRAGTRSAAQAARPRPRPSGGFVPSDLTRVVQSGAFRNSIDSPITGRAGLQTHQVSIDTIVQ